MNNLNFDPRPILGVAQGISIAISLVAAVAIVLALLKINQYWEAKIVALRGAAHPPKAGEDVYNIRWQEVRRHLSSTNDTEWKFAVIEADKIADDVLRKAGYPGETMGERMMLTDPGQLQSLQNLWAAHKLRNIIAHNPDYQVRYAEAHAAIENYEKALRELGELS